MVIITGIIALVSLFKCQCTLVWELKELTSSNSSKQAQNSDSEPSSLKNRPACQQPEKELIGSPSKR